MSHWPRETNRRCAPAKTAVLSLCLAAIAGAPASADVIGPGGKVIDCYCTDSTGGRVELGQQICLYVDGRAFMARCEMALNNPFWRETGEGCLSSQNQLSVPADPAPKS